MQAAAKAVVTIGRTLRASMMELMDQASINAVEDYRSMGLDREAGALLIAQSDAPGAACAAEVEIMQAACDEHGAKEVFVTDDPDESEMFVAARRLAFSAIEARGSILLEDVGAPIPQLPALLAAVAAVAEKYDVEVPWWPTPATGTPTRSWSSTRPTPTRGSGPISLSRRSWPTAIALGGTITGEHGVGRAKKGGAAGAARTRRDGAVAEDQGCAGPGGNPQPGGRLLTEIEACPPPTPGAIVNHAVPPGDPCLVDRLRRRLHLRADH